MLGYFDFKGLGLGITVSGSGGWFSGRWMDRAVRVFRSIWVVGEDRGCFFRDVSSRAFWKILEGKRIRGREYWLDYFVYGRFC